MKSYENPDLSNDESKSAAHTKDPEDIDPFEADPRKKVVFLDIDELHLPMDDR